MLPWLLSVHCRLCILTLLLCFQVLATQNLVSKVWSSDLCLRSFFGVEHQESWIINTSQNPLLFSLGAFYPGEACRKWASDVMISLRSQASVICNHLQHTHICTCATVITTCSRHYLDRCLHMCMCLHMSSYVCELLWACVYVHIYVHVWEGQRSISNVFRFFLPYFWGHPLSLNLVLKTLARLAAVQTQGTS